MKQDPKNDQYLFGEIISDSMSPLIKTGEKVRFRYLEEDEALVPYQCYVFKVSRENLKCHFYLREARIHRGAHIFCSLKLEGLDRPVYRKEILGVVEGKKVQSRHKLLLLIKKIWFSLVGKKL